MRLTIRNIGKISDASVDINGITVIAGENNSGKSTIGKTLFAVFNSFYKYERKIAAERFNSIENHTERLFKGTSDNFYFFDFDDSDLIKKIIEIVEQHDIDETMKQALFEAIFQYDERIALEIREEELLDFAARISAILKLENHVIFRSVMQRRLTAEFRDQIVNFYSGDGYAEIMLEIKGETASVGIKNDRVIWTDNCFSLNTEAIYIDDPFVLDEIVNRIQRYVSPYSDHRLHLKENLYLIDQETNVVDEILINRKLNKVYSKLSSVLDGNIVKGKRTKFAYKMDGIDKSLDIRNLSTGMKTFAILKMLLLNGKIETNGTIILDEPEIHLHPEWQLVFAELIVLLHKEFGLHILLNTHSPYFLNAIEVYSAKYGIDDKCKYYLMQSVEEISTVEDATDNIEVIYEKLARPLQILENERWFDA